jgi:hypothetical protein
MIQGWIALDICHQPIAERHAPAKRSTLTDAKA